MGYIYLYAPEEQDLTTIGIVGALLPTECEFNLKAGEFGELTMTHPCDPYGKWKAIEPDCILKAPIPVRLTPAFDENSNYVTQVWSFRVAIDSTTSERAIYKDANKSKKKKVGTLTAGQELISVSEYSDIDGRYKVTAKIKKKQVTGWVDEAALDISSKQEIPITPGTNGLEAVEASYAVKDQLFRITSVEKSDDNGGSLSVTAMRLAYDLTGVPADTYQKTEITGKQAARLALSDAYVQDTGFTIYSDVASKHVGVNFRGKSVLEALCDPEEGCAGLFNAQPIADDYDIYMLANAGMDRGVQIRYAKNLLGITCTADSSEVYEGVLPIGETNTGAPLYIADRSLPEGYHRGTGTKLQNVIYKNGVTTNTHRIYVQEVSDAKEDKKNGVPIANARQRLIDEAVKTLDSGVYLPKLTLDVNFVMLGDTVEYEQYKHLESLFVYDTVHIHHAKLGVNVDTILTELTWDCIAERVTEARFGELQDISPTISSYQLSGVSGSKITPGSINGSSIGDGSIKADHIQAESVNTQALQARSITGDKIAANTITGNEIAAGTVTANKLDATTVNAMIVSAASGNFDSVVAQAASLGVANVQHMIANAFNLTGAGGVATDLYIYNLRATYAQMMTAMMDMLVIKGDDGKYYTVTVSSGSLSAVEYTGGVNEQTGMTTDGTRALLPATMPTEILSGHTVAAVNGLINYVWAAQVSADAFFGREAVLNAIETSRIFGTGGRVEIIAKEVTPKIYRQEAQPALSGAILGSLWIMESTGETRQLVEYIDPESGVTAREWRLVQDEAIIRAQTAAIGAQATANAARTDFQRVMRVDADGVHVGDNQTNGEALIDSESFQIRYNSRTFSKFAGDYAQFGNYQLRLASDGGLLFKVKEG